MGVGTIGNKSVHLFNGYDFTAFLNNFSLPMKGKAAKGTTFGKTAQVYFDGAPQGADFTNSGFFSGSAGEANAVLRAALRGIVIYALCPTGNVDGSVSYGIKAVDTKHSKSSDLTNVVPIGIGGTSKVGGERCITLHALAAQTTDDQGTSIDNGAETTAGGAGYLQMTAVSGACVITLEHSDDDAATDPYTAIVTFDSMSTIGAQRVAVAKGTTIKQWVRAAWNVGTSATFYAGLCRFPA
jgi:hypothetical protein